MFDWLCRKRINRLVALNQTLNRDLQEVSDKVAAMEAILDARRRNLDFYETAHLDNLALLKRIRDELEATKETLEQEEADHQAVHGFLDNIDNTISEALKFVGLFPGKPAGFPDRVDAICSAVKEYKAEIKKLVEQVGELEATLGDEETAHQETLAFIDHISLRITEALKEIGHQDPAPESGLSGVSYQVDVLCSAVKEYRAEVERLTQMIADPEFRDTEIERGLAAVTSKPHWAVKFIAGSFAETLGEAPNWSAIEVGPFESHKGKLLVTVQRMDGTTPVDSIKKQDARIADLEKALAGLLVVPGNISFDTSVEEWAFHDARDRAASVLNTPPKD